MKEMNRRDVLKASIIGITSLFTGVVFLPKLADGKAYKKTDNGVQYKADFTTTPEMLGFTSRLEIPPEGGWKADTYYVIDSSSSLHNPITRRIFYTGFAKYGKPNHGNCVISHWYGPSKSVFPVLTPPEREDISNWYYTKAIREIDIFE